MQLVWDGKVSVVDGLDCFDNAVKSIEYYDPSNNTWNVVGETTEELYGHSILAF